MREMEFTIENTEALKPGMEVNVTEGVTVKELKETSRFHIAVPEFDE